MALEKKNGDFIRASIRASLVNACHDLSDGGLAIAIAEMALAGNIGARIDPPGEDDNPPMHAWLFGEDQARYLVTTNDPKAFLDAAAAAAVRVRVIGRTGGSEIALPESNAVTLRALRRKHEGWMHRYMENAEVDA